MKILFCGSEIKGNFIGEICKRKKYEIIYSKVHNRINSYEDIIFGAQYDAIVIDVSDLIDEAITIIEYLKRLKTAKHCKVIVFAAGFTYKSRVIEPLIQAGFVNFILSSSLASQNDDFEKCINGYYEENGLETEIIEEEKIAEIEREHAMAYTTFGVAGVINRIGTTTQALQLVKFFKIKGYKACYVEANASMFIDKCVNIFTITKTDNDHVVYCDIDMYKSNQINNLVLAKYDYLVYDYGSIENPSFNKLSFNEKDMTIFVAGSSPDELEKVSPVLESNLYRESILVFNFVAAGDKKEILESMCDRADNTCFTAYVPDPFDYVNCEDGFKKVIDIPNVGDMSLQQKRGIFDKLMKRKAKV